MTAPKRALPLLNGRAAYHALDLDLADLPERLLLYEMNGAYAGARGRLQLNQLGFDHGSRPHCRREKEDRP
jgi:hypothetical protein